MAAYATVVCADRGAGYSVPSFVIVTEDGGRYEFVYDTPSHSAPEMMKSFLENPMVSRIQSDLWPNLDRTSGKDLATLFLANAIWFVEGPAQYPDWEQAMAAAIARLPRQEPVGG